MFHPTCIPKLGKY